MLSRLLPKESNFFDLFDKQVAFAIDGAKHFKNAAASAKGVDENILSKMREIEHQADAVTHSIIERLNTTFITPFDREDIHALATEIDDIVDMIQTIVGRLKVYKVVHADKNLIDFAEVIYQSVVAVAAAVNGMRNMKKSKTVMDACVEVNRLENVGDHMRDRVLGELFEGGRDPMDIIKWKEIYQDAETVLDICEDVAHVVGSILVKYA